MKTLALFISHCPALWCKLMQVVTYHYWQCELLWCLSAYKQHRHCWFLLVHNQRYCHFWESHSSDRECITYHAHPKTQTHIQITVWILLTLQLYTKHKCTHTLIQRLSTFVDTVHICRYRIRCNLWKVLIIGTPNFNYLIRSNSWNEWIFGIKKHFNHSNGQVLLYSALFSPATMSLTHTTNFFPLSIT